MIECTTFPELEFSEWGTELQSKLKGRRYPLTGVLELTDRCNLSCVHCYINQDSSNKTVKARELTTIQIKDILDQLVNAGCLTLTLTGGEILLRPDFVEIYTYARKLGLLISLFTNGTLITPRIADVLKEFRPMSIEITLYGATKETYERVTSIPGSYDKSQRGIKLLLERQLPLVLKSFLLTLNRHELSKMMNYAKELDVPFRFDGMTFPRLDGDLQPLNYQLSAEEMVSLDYEDPERIKELSILINNNPKKVARAEDVYFCSAGLRSFHIDSTGRLSICTMSRTPSYDLLRMSFQEAWGKLGELRLLKRQMDNACRSCTLGGLCVQCPGWSQAIHGDNETPVDFVCQIAHLRVQHIQNIRV